MSHINPDKRSFFSSLIGKAFRGEGNRKSSSSSDSSVPKRESDQAIIGTEEKSEQVAYQKMDVAKSATPSADEVAPSAPETLGAKAAQQGVSLNVHVGDIGQVAADSLVTPVNSGGMWFGAIDGVIQRNAGSQFHNQAMAASPLVDGQTVVARSQEEHRGAFKDVVFVIDDLQQPLRKVVSAGLQAADKAGHKSVSLPTMRMGVMMGAVEPTADATLEEMAAGVNEFLESQPQNLKDITFVSYRDREVASELEKKLN